MCFSFSRMKVHCDVLQFLDKQSLQYPALSMVDRALLARKPHQRRRATTEMQDGPFSTLAYPRRFSYKVIGTKLIRFSRHSCLTCEIVTASRNDFEVLAIPGYFVATIWCVLVARVRMWRGTRCSAVRSFFICQYSHILWLIEASSSLIKILLSACFSFTSPYRSVFVISSSAYKDGIMFDRCAKCIVPDSVSAMISSVAYFFSKR